MIALPATSYFQLLESLDIFELFLEVETIRTLWGTMDHVIQFTISVLISR